MNFCGYVMDTQWLIVVGVLLFCTLLYTAHMTEKFEDAEDADDGNDDDDNEDNDVGGDEEQEPGDEVRPLTTEPDTRKPPKEKSSLPAAPVVAEGDAPKAKKPIQTVKKVTEAAIKTSVADVKKAFKIEKADPMKQAMANFLDKDAMLFTPRKMLCLPSTSGFQCLYR